MARVPPATERAWLLLASMLSDRDFCNFRLSCKAGRGITDYSIGRRLSARGHEPIYYLASRDNFPLAGFQVTLGWPVGSAVLLLAAQLGQINFFVEFAPWIQPVEAYCLQAICSRQNLLLQRLLELNYPVTSTSEVAALKSRNREAQRLLREGQNNQGPRQDRQSLKRSQSCM